MPEAHTNISDNAVRNPAERGLSLKKCTWSRSDTIRSAGEGEGFVPFCCLRASIMVHEREERRHDLMSRRDFRQSLFFASLYTIIIGTFM